MSNGERIRPPWWLKYVNKMMIGLQRLGVDFGGKGPVVLTVPGRKSGKPRSTPITPMTVDGKRYHLCPHMRAGGCSIQILHSKSCPQETTARHNQQPAAHRHRNPGRDHHAAGRRARTDRSYATDAPDYGVRPTCSWRRATPRCGMYMKASVCPGAPPKRATAACAGHPTLSYRS
jgi:hypothetical protein